MYCVNTLGIREQGLEILSEVAENSKKYVYAGSASSFAYNTKSDANFKELIEKQLKRNGKEEFMNNLKLNHENIDNLQVK